MKRVQLGTSVEGAPIEAFVRAGPGGGTVLVLGGFHGDEPKGVALARRLIERLAADRRKSPRCVVVPLLNPDGYRRRRRRNANMVDLNRNLPTANWRPTSRRSRMYGGEAPGSEPETQAAMSAVRRFKPVAIITIHSIDGRRQCNNYDGPGLVLARRMHRGNGYPVVKSIGYPTPGSFGTWAGTERHIATLTLELPSHHSIKRCWVDNADALIECCLTRP